MHALVAESRTQSNPQARGPELEQLLDQLLLPPDEDRAPREWLEAQHQVRELAQRPAKRIRPGLVLLGFRLAGGARWLEPEVLRFGAALEALHTFLLIHDDLADRAEVRRGGPALHHLLGRGKLGEDLAVVMGDHLFARSLEGMLSAALPGTAAVTRFWLQVCRRTAIGQLLDLRLAQAPLDQVKVTTLLKVARLKTAEYGFVAPLVSGVRLAGSAFGAEPALRLVGGAAGIAFQLQDDLLGLFGDPADSGKAGDGDFLEGKRTLPLIAAYRRAPPQARAELTALWSSPSKTAAELARARALIRGLGGEALTLRRIDRLTGVARRGLELLPENPARAELDRLLTSLVGRNS